METHLIKVGAWLMVALLALFASALALDSGFAVHMGIASAAALLVAWVTLTRADYKVLTGLKPATMPDVTRYDDDLVHEQSYSERQIFEAASSRLARELAAMEKTDEPSALQKILAILNEHAPKYYAEAAATV